MSRDIHIKLKFKKVNKDKIKLFHMVCNFIDKDWPYVGSVGRPLNGVKCLLCEKCKGRVYRNPGVVLTPMVLISIAEHLGIKDMVIKHYAREDNCWAPGAVPRHKVLEFEKWKPKTEGETEDVVTGDDPPFTATTTVN